jgi:short-subunit dehydrogenase
MLSKGLLLQVGSEDIRVTTVNPGGVDTPFWGDRKVDKGKLMQAEEVVDVLLFVLTSNPSIQIHSIDFESKARF